MYRPAPVPRLRHHGYDLVGSVGQRVQILTSLSFLLGESSHERRLQLLNMTQLPCFNLHASDLLVKVRRLLFCGRPEEIARESNPGSYVSETN